MKKKMKKNQKILLAFGFAAMLALTACGGQTAQSGTASSASGEESAGQSAQTAATEAESSEKSTAAIETETFAEKAQEDAKNDILVLAYPKDLGDMNPHTMKSPMYAQDWVYDGLTALVNGKLEPELAERWEISEDGKTYTFYLRPEVKFSDGSDLTAELVIRNIQDVIDNKDGYTFLQSLEEIDSMEAPDAGTVVMHLKNPCNSLLSDMSFTRPLVMAGEAAFPESGSIYKDGVLSPIGTGMWMVEEYVQDQYAIFEQNPYYWGEKPYFEKVKVLVIPDIDTAANALKAGEIDMYIDVNDGISADLYNDLKNAGFSADVEEGTQVTSLSLNTAGEILGDVKVRQALAYATDNSLISEYVFGGLQKPASSYFADSISQMQTGTEWYPYDVDKANSLLEEAGWIQNGDYREKDGQTLEADLLYDTVFKNGKNIGLVLQEQYKAVGLKLNICEEDSQVFRQKWKDGEFGMILYSSWGGSYEPFATLAAMRMDGDKFHTVQKGMENKKELDEVMGAALSETDETKLAEELKYVTDSFKEQAVYIPLTQSSTIAVYDSGLTGPNLDDAKDVMSVGNVAKAALSQ